MAKSRKNAALRLRGVFACAVLVGAGLACGDARGQGADLPFGLRGLQGEPVAGTVPVPAASPQRPVGAIEGGNPFEIPEETAGRALPAAPEPPFPIGGSDDGPANPPAAPIQAGASGVSEENPFEPAGFRIGTWLANARIGQSIGYSTNAAKAPGGAAGAVALTDGNFEMRSDWSRHAASLRAGGSYEEDFGSGTGDTPFATLGGALRLDLFDGNQLDFDADYTYTTEEITSRSLDNSVTDRPGINNYNGEIGWLRGDRKIVLGLRGSVERETYGDAEGAAGETINQTDRNNTIYLLRGRVGYEVSPAIVPFAEAGIGKRSYDNDTDATGYARDGGIYELRGGAAIDLGEKLRGEISVVYLSETFENEVLDDVGVTGLDANLVWSPWRGTEITFLAETGFDLSSEPGSSGSISRLFAVEGRRVINSRLLAKAALGLQIDTYDDDSNDFTYTAGAGLEYAVNRYLRLTLDADYEQYDSALPGSSWDAATIMVGAALQR